MRINVLRTLVALVTMLFYLYAFKGLGGKIRSTSHEAQESISVMSERAQEKIPGSFPPLFMPLLKISNWR